MDILRSSDRNSLRSFYWDTVYIQHEANAVNRVGGTYWGVCCRDLAPNRGSTACGCRRV